MLKKIKVLFKTSPPASPSKSDRLSLSAPNAQQDPRHLHHQGHAQAPLQPEQQHSPPSTGSLVSSLTSLLPEAEQAGTMNNLAYNPTDLSALPGHHEDGSPKTPALPLPDLQGYTLLEVLGDGAFSKVYKAREDATGKEVAVKVVERSRLSATQQAAILKEVTIMRQLRHPNITRLEGFLQTPAHFFLFLEIIPGGELFHRIVRLTYFSEPLARHVALQIGEAIRHLHLERGIVHRDIKPENLLFDPIPLTFSSDGDGESTSSSAAGSSSGEDKIDEGLFLPGVGGGGIGRVVLADFGLSKVVWEEDTATPCGTVGYTAPEIVRDQRYTTGVDMWALGCVLYTMLCGFPPFYDESIRALTEKVARGHYTFLSPWWDEISDEAKDLVSHLLEVDPAKRYSITDFLQHPWCRQGILPPDTLTATTSSDSIASAPVPTPVSIPTPRAIRTRKPHRPSTPLGGAVNVMGGGLVMKAAMEVAYAEQRYQEEDVAPSFSQQPQASSRGQEGARSHAEAGPLRHLRAQEVPRRASPLSTSAPTSVSTSPQRASRRHHVPPTPTFQLNMDGATLLGRRRQHGMVLGS